MNNRKQQQPQEEPAFSRSYQKQHTPRAIIYLKKQRKHEDAGWLYIRVSFQGQRTERSLGIKVKESVWNQADECITGNMQLTRQIWDEREQFLSEISDGLHFVEQLTGSSPNIRQVVAIGFTESLVPNSIMQIFEQ